MSKPTPRHFGLIGYPLSHSFSKRYFTEKFAREGIQGCRYELFPLADISELPGLLAAQPHLHGLNVTIPYKEQVLPYLHDIDPAAAAIGAVNTIRIAHGRLMGFNTDVIGFRLSLQKALALHGHPVPGALVLGTGGAAKAVVQVLQQMGIPHRSVSRHAQGQELSYEAVDSRVLAAHTLVINTTPLGMSPHADTCPPIPYEALGSTHLLFDLVYNPLQTRFILNGKKMGCSTQNGLDMLELQAEAAWEIWNAGEPGT